MKLRRFLNLFLATVAALGIQGCSKRNPVSTERGGLRANKSLSVPPSKADPVADPDKFAWQVFAEINQSAGDGTPNLVWESWATDGVDLFGDPIHTPDWNTRHTHELVLEPILEAQMLRTSSRASFRADLTIPLPPTGPGQEVRLNKAVFDYVVTNQLWYQEGLLKVFNTRFKVNFPQDAIEVKAIWEPLNNRDKSRYHWRADNQGNVYVLTALHIITKTTPNWTWATFEQVDNPARLASKDRFGSRTTANTSNESSPELRQLLASAGLGKEWLNYRLDGTQSDYTDSTGKPTLLGNSKIEVGEAGNTSCMTCHAQAAIDKEGMPVAAEHGDQVGVPDPSWFQSGNNLIALQTDFVWSFAQAKWRSGASNPLSEWMSTSRRVIPLQ